MLCPNCSTENSDDAKFCMACGRPLAVEPNPPAPDAPPPPVTPPAGANPWLPDGPETPVDHPPAEVAVTPPVEAPAPVPAAEPGPPDPLDMAAHLARMSDATRPHAELPILLASLLLSGSETVDVVVPGLIDDIVGVAVVTDERVLLVNGRRWNPAAYEFRIGPGLVVEGWQDADTAMLTFIAEVSVRISAIVDKPLAFEAARVVRERVAALTV